LDELTCLDAMKGLTIVEFQPHVFSEVFSRLGGIFGIKLYLDISFVGLEKSREISDISRLRFFSWS
jgi:hypothetical protein